MELAARLFWPNSFPHRAWPGHGSSLHRFVVATLQSAVKADSGKEGRQENGFSQLPRAGGGAHLAKLS